jgi:hypothetical protein
MDLGIRVAKVLGWIVAVIVALVGYLYYHSIPYEHRFRLTFDVTVDGQVKQGTGVISVFDTDLRKLPLSQSEWKRRSKGPSPWVDLGPRGVLAIAMQPHANNYRGQMPMPASMLSFVAFYEAAHGNSKISEETVLGIRNMKGQRKLSPDLVQFIWFPKPDDPNSVEFVLPTNNSLSILTEQGIRLGPMTVEITNDKPDDSLFAKLPWLSAMEQQQREHPITSIRRGNPLRADHLLGYIF